MARSSAANVTIKHEHTDGTYFQQVVPPRTQVLPKEVKREKSHAPSPPAIQVCPINVVQGDSILVKLKYKDGQVYNCLIDGGHAKHFSNVKSCMDEYDVMKVHGVQLHGIIVTHPDGDHLNGVTKLLEKHKHRILNNYDVLVTEAFYWRSRDNMCTKFLKQIDEVYFTRKVIRVDTSLRPGLKCYFPKELGCLLGCTSDISKLGHTQPSETFLKESPKHVDVNETSILTVINESESKCDAVLTGDSTAEEILPLVEGKVIRIFQVPHHGSLSNSRLKDKRKLVEYSGQCNFSIVHNNEVRETLLFYSTFRAQCYLISAGGTDNYKHPNPYVLQGIILANSLQCQECVIVLTNSRGLNSEMLKQLHRLVPQWTRYVRIYHYDDNIFFTEQYHTSLRPEKCISDIRTNTVEWTPEGYINRTRFMLPVKPTVSDSRPLERTRFMEQSTVEITIQETLKFSAHIICIPLPHNPRSGDKINCCYVIEESIASGAHFSQALFLVDNDERIRSLSRAKKYDLFQYVNNEWQRKQLPATVKDISPRTSPCHIPYDNIKSLWPVQDSSTQISSRSSNHQRIKSPQPISPQTPPNHVPCQSTNSVRPGQGSSPQTPPSRIPHQSTNSVRPVQDSSAQISPRRSNHQRIKSPQPISPQTPPSRIPCQSTNSVRPGHGSSPQPPPCHIPHQTLQPLQNISPQTLPSRINPLQPVPPQASPYGMQQLHLDINSLQIGSEGAVATSDHAEVHIPQPRLHATHQGFQPVSSQVSPYGMQQLHQDINTLQIGSEGAHQSTNPLQPALDSTLQTSPYSMQQLGQGINSLQRGSERATVGTSNHAGVDLQLLQHRLQATQQSILGPSPAQYYGHYELSTKGCRCQKIECATNQCGCRKQGLYCGPNCQCSNCKNYQQHVSRVSQHQSVNPIQLVLDASPQYNIQGLHQDMNLFQTSNEEATLATNNHAGIDPHVLQQRVQATQHGIVRPSPAQYYGQYESPTKGCRCQKIECTTNQCGCRKQGLYCGPNCRCYNCKNNQQYAFQAPQHQLTVTPDRMRQAVVKLSPTKGCGCTTGCGTMRCGCKKQGLACGPSCKCRNTYLNCVN